MHMKSSSRRLHAKDYFSFNAASGRFHFLLSGRVQRFTGFTFARRSVIWKILASSAITGSQNV